MYEVKVIQKHEGSLGYSIDEKVVGEFVHLSTVMGLMGTILDGFKDVEFSVTKKEDAEEKGEE